MRKILISVLSSLLFFAAVSSAGGQAPAVTDFQERTQKFREEAEARRAKFNQQSEERRQEFLQKQEELKAQQEERREKARLEAEERLREAKERADKFREEAKARIAEHRKQALRQLISRLITRLHALVDRLELVADRIQSRIDKFAAEGADTGDAQTQLDAARAKLAEARGQIDALAGIDEDLLTAENPRDFFVAVKDQVLLIKSTLREAHRLLASSVSEIKGFSEVRAEEGETDFESGDRVRTEEQGEEGTENAE